MYKDKESQKEANRLAAQKRRDKQKGMTQGITINKETSYPDKENVIPWYPNKKTDKDGNEITPITLSDGQLWYPDPTVKRTIKKEIKASNYSPIIEALSDPIKRKKLESITESLKNHNQLENVRYGLGDDSVTFDVIEKYLSCF